MANPALVNSDGQTLAMQAIGAAVSLKWDEALKINRKILSLAKNDVEALNRLALAQTCLGKTLEAQRTYKKVLAIDPYNIIAKKNLEKLTKSNGYKTTANHNGHDHDLSRLFLFEPGKTKLISLLNLAPPQVLAVLNCGDEVLINPKNHSVTITNTDNVYLGALPDDLAHRLIAFIAGGNRYDAYVKATTLKSLTIFIREVDRSPKFSQQPSFTASAGSGAD